MNKIIITLTKNQALDLYYFLSSAIDQCEADFNKGHKIAVVDTYVTKMETRRFKEINNKLIKELK